MASAYRYEGAVIRGRMMIMKLFNNFQHDFEGLIGILILAEFHRVCNPGFRQCAAKGKFLVSYKDITIAEAYYSRPECNVKFLN